MDDATASLLRAAESVCVALEERWAAGDWTGFAALHAEDASYVAFDGTLMNGRAAIAAGHRPLFEGIMRGSRLVTLDRAIRQIGDDLAVAIQRAGIVMRWQGERREPSRKRLSTATLTLRRAGEGAEVVAFQNTRFHPWVSALAGRMFARGAEQPPVHTLLGS
ncbi:MAG: SgcJ/EcaC family oxidoreductase [Actinomycetales bacterium]|nr:SgcJ/EcaC family oxidoreductase [Actinomycetales bacterium]